MYDIALPEGNEEELAKKYLENRIRNVVFAYFVKDKKDLEKFLLKNLFRYKGLNIFYLAIIDEKKPKDLLKLSSDLFYSEKYYNDLVFINFNKEGSDALNKYFYNGIYLKEIVGDEKYFIRNLDMRSLYKIKKNRQSILISLKDSIEDPYPFGYLIKILQKKDFMFLFGSFASEKSEVPNKYAIKSFYRVFGIDYKIKVMDKFLFYQIKRTRLAKNKLCFMKGYYIVKMPYEDCSEY